MRSFVKSYKNLPNCFHQVALLLLRERSRLVVKLIESRDRCSELEHLLKEETEKSSALEENLERQVVECEQLCARLTSAESLNRSLQMELDDCRSAAATGSNVEAAAADAGSRLSSSASQPVVADSRSSLNRNSPRMSGETVVKSGKNVDLSVADRSDALGTGPGDRWATPINRNMAAARLRTVLSAAIEGATPGSDVSSSARQQPSTGNQQSRFTAIATSKLPQVTSSSSSMFVGIHSVHRSVVLPPTTGSPTSAPGYSQSLADGRSSGGRLMPISPRLATLAPSSNQTNGSPTSSFILKPLNSNAK